MTDHDTTARRIVDREVYMCLSSLVSTLAKSANGMISSRTGRNPYLDEAIRGTMALADQAYELAMPIPDYESAARDAGWGNGDDAIENLPNDEGYWLNPDRWHDAGNPIACVTAQEACEHDDIEPYDREVFEHWAISGWLADKLEAKGEKVDRDFAGMIVWARTTTGQAIYCDGVIQDTAAEIDGDASC